MLLLVGCVACWPNLSHAYCGPAIVRQSSAVFDFEMHDHETSSIAFRYTRLELQTTSVVV